MKALGAFVLAVGIVIGVAPPAAADESHYLSQLQPKLVFLSAGQLRAEGYRVCRYMSVGRPSPDAVPLVAQDLGVSVAAATMIVAAAIEELDC
jgi:hypothetical protein